VPSEVLQASLLDVCTTRGGAWSGEASHEHLRPSCLCCAGCRQIRRKYCVTYENAERHTNLTLLLQMYTIYIAKATANYGLPATRPIYQRAIEVLPDRQTAEMCLRFAAMERKLGEIDRARAIYAHASQFCDPRTYPEFWKEWNSFESKSYGLRVPREASLTFMLYQSTLVRRIPSEKCCASSDQCRRHSIPSTCLIHASDKARADHRFVI
jgi:hypothetical protein